MAGKKAAKHRNNIITRPSTQTIRILDGNGIYTCGVWGVDQFREAINTWLLTEKACDGMRFIRTQPRKQTEILVYQGVLWDVTSPDAPQIYAL